MEKFRKGDLVDTENGEMFYIDDVDENDMPNAVYCTKPGHNIVPVSRDKVRLANKESEEKIMTLLVDIATSLKHMDHVLFSMFGDDSDICPHCGGDEWEEVDEEECGCDDEEEECGGCCDGGKCGNKNMN